MFVPGTVTVWLPHYLYRSQMKLDAVRVNSVLMGAVFLLALGAVGYFWCAWDFAFTGRGTPAPFDPPKALVVRGLYQYVRNPMYWSILLILFGESLLFGSRSLLRYAVGWWAIVHLFVMFYEEPALRRKFGASYEEYCRRVWRWIPKIPRAAKNHAV